ncbi:MAG: diguanylate cyclase domain-containing protein [Candidatus Tyrphobacter sp.]
MEFAATREVLASLFEESPTATLLCDGDARIIAANSAAERLTGFARGQLLGLTCRDLSRDGLRLERAMRRAAGGGSERLEVELATCDASAIPAACEAFAARLQGHIYGVFLQILPQCAALLDGVTGLPNRVLLDDRIAQTLVAARRYRRGFALMYVDVDEAPDDALRAVAQRLRTVLRESDTIARVGGDDFAVLQPMIDDSDDAVDVARKIIFALRAPIVVDVASLELRASVGIAVFPGNGESAGELVMAADRALDRARSQAEGWALATRPAKETAT